MSLPSGTSRLAATLGGESCQNQSVRSIARHAGSLFLSPLREAIESNGYGALKCDSVGVVGQKFFEVRGGLLKDG